MEKSPVNVLFRVSKGEREEVVAVIAERGARTFDSRGVSTCYAHVGQHSECHLSWYFTTRKATPAEYGPLLKELAAIGYEVKVARRRVC